MKYTFTVLLVVFLLVPAIVHGQIIITEALVDEPAGETSLEWFEIYNDLSGRVYLSFFEFWWHNESDSTSFDFLDGDAVLLQPREYLVICRNATRFEEHYGDSSGVWEVGVDGDYRIVEAPIRLNNASGKLKAVLITPWRLLSLFEWGASGSDGVSWERTSLSGNDIALSIDPSGSTPGRINSVTTVPVDLALLGVSPVMADGATDISFSIKNTGETAIADAELRLYHVDSTAPDLLGELIAAESVGALDTGYTVILIGRYFLADRYQSLAAVLPEDDRPDNSRLDFVAPGGDFPPAILNEFLPDPYLPLTSEWVEIKNISDEDLNLQGWALGDSLGTVAISSEPLTLPVDSYLVLVADSTAFRFYYQDFSGILHQPAGWPILNNSGADVVRLLDGFGLQTDRFHYDQGMGDNHSWSRGESERYADRWDRADSVGGSPGRRNVVSFAAQGSDRLEVFVSPRVFSPDGDGYQDQTELQMVAPEADSYTLKIFDREGRRVRTYLDNETRLSDEPYVWDGRNDSGERLPVGIYIVFCEASGVESFKTTVVIAR